VTNEPRDIWDDAMDAEYVPQNRPLFGQVAVDIFPCVLTKGIGKVPFDEGQHQPEQKRTSVSISILPLPSSPLHWETKRDMLAESKEWASIVRQSLRDCGTDLRSVNGKWASIELVKVGTYTNKAGEEKDRTAIKFLAIYPSEAACEAASVVSWHGETAAPQTPLPKPAPAASGLSRENAAKFLPALWKSSGEDPAKFADLLAKNTAIGHHFDLSSPEVLALVGLPF